MDIITNEGWDNQIHNSLIVNKLPESIRRYDHEFIFYINEKNTFLNFKAKNFWLANDPNSGSDIIPKRSGHGKSRNILLFKPNPIGPHFLAIFIIVRKNSPPINLDPIRLFRILPLMII
jgi:hypothetical protein